MQELRSGKGFEPLVHSEPSVHPKPFVHWVCRDNNGHPESSPSIPSHQYHIQSAVVRGLYGLVVHLYGGGLLAFGAQRPPTYVHCGIASHHKESALLTVCL